MAKQKQRFVYRFQESGAVEDRRHGNCGHLGTVKMLENIEGL